MTDHLAEARELLAGLYEPHSPDHALADLSRAIEHLADAIAELQPKKPDMTRLIGADPDRRSRPRRIPFRVTRVDVVDRNGVREFWADSWEVHISDEGRTVKLIGQDDGAAAKAKRDAALAKDMSEDVARIAAVRHAETHTLTWCSDCGHGPERHTEPGPVCYDCGCPEFVTRVDCLGPDKQDRTWRDKNGNVWSWKSGWRWVSADAKRAGHLKVGGHPSPLNGPFTKVEQWQ